jgi:hypothetical protein
MLRRDRSRPFSAEIHSKRRTNAPVIPAIPVIFVRQRPCRTRQSDRRFIDKKIAPAVYPQRDPLMRRNYNCQLKSAADIGSRINRSDRTCNAVIKLESDQGVPFFNPFLIPFFYESY